MITKIKIQNFKCFDDFELDLKPFNVLVGPNDSGKTSLLQALAIAAGSPYVRIALNNLDCSEFDLGLSVFSFGKQKAVFKIEDTDFTKETTFVPPHQGDSGPELMKIPFSYIRFIPSQLRMPTGNGVRFSSNGSGFPTFLCQFVNQDRQMFFEMEKHFYDMFPAYATFSMPANGVNNALKFKTRNGSELDANSVSDGTILYLAYLAVMHQPNPPKILLIEEPETGVHYASLKDIVISLKKLCKEKEVQIVMTTHSPYLLDCVEPEDVCVFAKNKKTGAVKAKRLSEFEGAQRLQKHFMTGEIWTEYSENDIVFGKDSGE